MSAKKRAGTIQGQPAYILHTYPHRESSLLLEVFSAEYGRLPLMAKGARRPHSTWRGLMLPFQPLVLNWSGQGEVRTLAQAVWQGGVPQLGGQNLICGLYLNELMIHLWPREESSVLLFAEYDRAIRALGQGETLSPLLRRFEFYFLKELGYGFSFDPTPEALEAHRQAFKVRLESLLGDKLLISRKLFFSA